MYKFNHSNRCKYLVNVHLVPVTCIYVCQRVNIQPRASPRAGLGHLMHDESRGVGHLAVNTVVSRSPVHLQATKSCFVTCRHLLRRSESRVLEQEEHLSTMKDLQNQ